MLWILFSMMAVLAIVLVVVLGMRTVEPEPEEPARVPLPEQDLPHPRTMLGLGAPLFDNASGMKSFVVGLQPDDVVWATTPCGPQQLTINHITDGVVHLSNDDYEAESEWKDNYFSEEVAQKSGRHGAWVLTRFASKSGGNVVYGTQHQRENQRFVRDKVDVWEDDTLDWMIFYWFMFDGFHEPYDYYDQYKVPSEVIYIEPEPVEEPPPVFEEPLPVEEPVADVPAEATEEQMNEFNDCLT